MKHIFDESYKETVPGKKDYVKFMNMLSAFFDAADKSGFVVAIKTDMYGSLDKDGDINGIYTGADVCILKDDIMLDFDDRYVRVSPSDLGGNDISRQFSRSYAGKLYADYCKSSGQSGQGSDITHVLVLHGTDNCDTYIYWPQ